MGVGPSSWTLCYLLEQVAGVLDRPLLAQLRRPACTRLASARVVQQCAKRGGNVFSGELRGSHPSPNAEPRKARGIIRLIESHRHRQLRRPGRDRLREGADAAVMDDGRTSRQHGREGYVGFVVYAGGKRRKLRPVSGEQERPFPESLGRADCFTEERLRELVRRSRCEQDWRVSVVEKAFDGGWHVLLLGFVIQRKPG